ncbi:Laccase-9 [Hibiscus syriacus]|uniref:laccase n=1 Tax=Hibiscus syriacus TaxID=106335 RepID=A0A6A3B5V6_HIBSY|nr:Laccase-9 [Hibiscus syriacus]
MGRHVFLFACTLLLFAASATSAAGIVEHSFYVKNLTVSRLCKTQVITAVNGGLPGPTIRVQEGDTLVVHVFNLSPYNMTIHWHGVFQMLSSWADGPSMSNRRGTLWWHAHVSYLRSTVYGALIIRPRDGHPYPFHKPYREVPIILGEWWNGNVVDVDRLAAATGASPIHSDAFTINGWPGDTYPCSKHQMFELTVLQGKTYLLRIINAALNSQFFYKIANHKMTVVAIDASYVEPYITDVVVTTPGQTVDVLLTADQPIDSYYMAARPYATAVPFRHSTNTPVAHKFYTGLKGLVGGRFWDPVPLKVDHKMFITIGLALEPCPANTSCKGPKLSASMNNESFMKPTSLSLLQAFYQNVNGVYTTDFPAKPPIEFDYTSDTVNELLPMKFAPKNTKVTKLKFNSTVEIIFQNTNILGPENHPMHLHGFDFYILAQGFGNYNPATDRKKLNLINPQIRNTIGVPVGGWAVIRFVANNPGVWLLHCHLDMHLPVGLATAFTVENGPTPETTLPPPPTDLPQC